MMASMTQLDLGHVGPFASRRIYGGTGHCVSMQPQAENIAMDGNLGFQHEALIDRSIREQYRFLDHCVENAVVVTVFLVSGAHFIGIVIEHDRKGILLGGKSIAKPKLPRMFMKSYIALIRPNEAIELFIQYRGMGTALKRKKALQKARKKFAKGQVTSILRSEGHARQSSGGRPSTPPPNAQRRLRSTLT